MNAEAAAAWSRCIDINIKGTLNGMIAVHDQMRIQGRGHIVNLSSIYGNAPVAGGSSRSWAGSTLQIVASAAPSD